MLYLSTENRIDSFTAHKVLRCADLPGGGMFLPMNVPVQNDIALAGFENMNTGEAIAAIMNVFFGTQLSGWDVDFAVGRQAVDLVSAGYKVSLAESWHNPAGSHSSLVQRLYHLVTRGEHSYVMQNLWFRTAVDIALLFAVYGKFCRQEIYEFDVAIQTGDLQQLLAVRYAQRMGLPINQIILGSMDGDGLWELFSFGTYQIGRKERLSCLEALLWLEFDYNEAENYIRTFRNKGIYRIAADKLERLRRNLFVSVVGDNRVKNVTDSALHSNNYRMESPTARAFAALQDYRAKTGLNKNTLLFARNAPVK